MSKTFVKVIYVYALENLVRILGLETTIIVPGHQDMMKLQAETPSSTKQCDCNDVTLRLELLAMTEGGGY